MSSPCCCAATASWNNCSAVSDCPHRAAAVNRGSQPRFRPIALSITNGRYNRVIPAVFLILLTLAFQAPPAADFDDLAHRAESILDTQPAEAAVLYRQALAIRPTWPEGWFYLGGALYQTGKFTEARDAFRKGIPLAPGNGQAWAFLGMCEGQLGDTGQALADIDKGEHLGLGQNVPFETAVRVEAALLLAKASLYDRAMAQLQPLGKMHVDNPAVSEVEGLCLFASGDVPEKLSPDRRKAIDLAGQAMWDASIEHPDKAAAEFKSLIAAYPTERGVHYAYGLYLMESDQSAALAEFQKEIAANPHHWPSLLIAAHLETAQGSPELAIQSVEQAAKLAPAGYRWLCEAEIGRALLSADHAAKAIPHLEESVKLEPGNAQTHFYLEQAYRLDGRKADAQREKAEFVRLKAQEDPLSLAPGR